MPHFLSLPVMPLSDYFLNSIPVHPLHDTQPPTPPVSDFKPPDLENLPGMPFPAFRSVRYARPEPREDYNSSSQSSPGGDEVPTAPNRYTMGEVEETALLSPASSRTFSGLAVTPPLPPMVSPGREAIRGSPILGDAKAIEPDDRSPSPVGSRADRTRQHDAGQRPTGRALRRRTMQQTHPYKFDKHQHILAKSGEKQVEIHRIEQAVQKEVADTPAKKRVGKSLVKNSRKRRRSGSFDDLGAPTTKLFERREYDPSRTTLRIWLDGFPGASAPTTLEACDKLDKLIRFGIESWKFNFNGKFFHYAIASFPWLEADSNILIRPGLEDSFRKMVWEIENAPVWADETKDTCEVKITLYLQSL